MSSKNLAQGGAVIYPASKSPEFYTPRWLREAVWRGFGVPSYDPATAPHNPMRAEHFTCEDGLAGLELLLLGLSKAPRCFNPRPAMLPAVRALETPLAFVWCNPPYGRGVGEWLNALSMLALSRPETTLLALLPCRPGSGWYMDATALRGLRGLTACQAFCELRGRLTFEQVSGEPYPYPARWSSALLYWGPDRARFMRWARPFGLVRPGRPRPRPPGYKLSKADLRQLKLV